MNTKSLTLLALSLTVLLGCGILGQSSEEKKAEKERVALAVNRQLDAKDYEIEINYMMPLRGGGQIVSGSYAIIVKDAVIDSHLPYVGVAQSVPYGGGKVLTFKDDIDKYADAGWKKGLRTIVFSTNNEEDTIQYTLDISEDGQVNVRVHCRERDDISYRGVLKTGE